MTKQELDKLAEEFNLSEEAKEIVNKLAEKNGWDYNKAHEIVAEIKSL